LLEESLCSFPTASFSFSTLSSVESTLTNKSLSMAGIQNREMVRYI
jgi:hypothetical protein